MYPRLRNVWSFSLLVACLVALVGCARPGEIVDLRADAVCWGPIEACEQEHRWEPVGERGVDAALVVERTQWVDDPVSLRFPLAATAERFVRIEGGRSRWRVAFDGQPVLDPSDRQFAPSFVQRPEGAGALLVESRRGLARAVWPFEVSVGTHRAVVSDTVLRVLVPSMLACWCAVVAVLQIAASLERRSRLGSLLVAVEAVALGARFVVLQYNWTDWWTVETAETARAIEYAGIPSGILALWAFYRWLAGGASLRAWESVFVTVGASLVLAPMLVRGPTLANFYVLRAIQVFAAVGLAAIAHEVIRAVKTLPHEARFVVLLGVASLLSGVALDLVVSLGTGGFVAGVGFVAFGFVIETTCQAIVVSMQNRRAHDRVDELAGELETKNEALAGANRSLEGANAKLEAANAGLAAELEERRRVQGELDVATQQLTQAENMATLGMLMAGIAHDLRNPLNYVQGAAEQLRAAIPNLQSDDEAVRAKTLGRVEKVVGWVEQGTASMDAISLAMRNQARSGGAELEDVNVRDVVNEALLLCRSRTKVCEVEVDVQDATIRADSTGLGQLVMNLVSNAADAIVEAREKNPEQPTKIRVSARVEGDAFTLAIEDSGPGIPEHVRARILEPFFTTKPRGQGTGLGLAIVQRVVKQHEGTLEIGRSDALGGARFETTWGDA